MLSITLAILVVGAVIGIADKACKLDQWERAVSSRALYVVLFALGALSAYLQEESSRKEKEQFEPPPAIACSP